MWAPRAGPGYLGVGRAAPPPAPPHASPTGGGWRRRPAARAPLPPPAALAAPDALHREGGHAALLHGLGAVGDVPARLMPLLLRLAHVRCAEERGVGWDRGVCVMRRGRKPPTWGWEPRKSPTTAARPPRRRPERVGRAADALNPPHIRPIL